MCRELDDAMLHLRFNETTVGTWVLKTSGDPGDVAAADEVLNAERDHWLVREIVLYWKRTLKRLDLSSRTLVALIEPGSCFAGTLAELALAADRSFMLEGTWENGDAFGGGGSGPGGSLGNGGSGEPAVLWLGDANDGWYPMSNGLTRLASRFWGHDAALDEIRGRFAKPLDAADCAALGLVTFTPDDIDWDDEVRLALEERAAFSPDALTGMEASLRFAGPETTETKIFGRLTAWQNWIFQRPNAAGPEGALRSYGTGSRPSFDRKRV